MINLRKLHFRLALGFMALFSCLASNVSYSIEGSQIESISDGGIKIAKEREKAIYAPIEELEFSPDGEVIAMLSTDQKVSIWRWRTDGEIKTLRLVDGANNSLTNNPLKFSPDGKFLAICHGGGGPVTVRVWETKNWSVIYDIKDNDSGFCTSIAFTPDAKQLVRAVVRNPLLNANSLISYDVGTWKEIWGVKTLPFNPYTMDFSKAGDKLLLGGYLALGPNAGSRYEIWAINVLDRSLVKRIDSGIDFLPGKVMWSPGGENIAAVGSPLSSLRSSAVGKPDEANDTFTLFDYKSGDKINRDAWPASSRMCMRYSKNGKYFAEGNRGSSSSRIGLKIWNSQHSKLLKSINGSVGAVDFSPDGNFVAHSDKNKIVVLRIDD